MCGIVGMLKGGETEKVYPKVIQEMCQMIVHRGPDDEGVFVAGRVGLGMRRLSIIDLHTGHQPIHNEDNTIWVVFNGEIYNYQELHDDLLKKGHSFYTQSDTEVIVHLYEEYGHDCFKYLNGMFGIAIWDLQKEQLVLGRDRLGKKPLYYSYDGSDLVFASELKAFLAIQDFPRQVNFEALDYFLTLGCVPGELCIFQNVQKLPAGHRLVLNKTGLQKDQYWRVNFFGDGLDRGKEYYVEVLRELFLDSIKKRLISDVPLGAFLSGGVDSSAVVAAMAQLGAQQIKTFSIGFGDPEFSELPYAREVANLLGTDHHELVVDPDMTKLFPELVWYFDEPFADSSAVPTYYVSQLAREHVKVALSGDGGDELFAGYTRYVDPFLARLIQSVPECIRVSFLHRAARCLPPWVKGQGLLRQASQIASEYYAGKMTTFYPEMKEGLYSAEYQNAINGSNPWNWFSQVFLELEGASEIIRRQYVDISYYLPDSILTKVDRASMAVSLETRSPFLDYRIAEFAGTLPDRYKIVGSQKKFLIKEMAKSWLPATILYRQKKGFNIPKDSWLRNQLREFSSDVLLSARAQSRGYFRTAYIEKLLEDHQTGRKDLGDQIWALVCLELWHLKFMDEVKQHPRELLMEPVG